MFRQPFLVDINKIFNLIIIYSLSATLNFSMIILCNINSEQVSGSKYCSNKNLFVYLRAA